MKPHLFEVFDGEDEYAPGTWCKHCNCTREEGNAHGLHIEWGVDELSGEYFIESPHGRIREGLTYAQAMEICRPE